MARSFKSIGRKTLGEVFHLSASIKPYAVSAVTYLILKEKNKTQTQTTVQFFHP